MSNDDTHMLQLEALVGRLRRYIDLPEVMIPERDTTARVWVELAAIDDEIAAVGLDGCALEEKP